MNRVAVPLVVLGWLIFVVSFFLAAFVTVMDLGNGTRMVLNMTFTGWFWWYKIVGSGHGLRPGALPVIIVGLAMSTNLVMLASPWGLFKPRSWLAGVLPPALLVGLLVDLGGLGVWERETIIGPGYYSWLASFLVVAAGLHLVRRKAMAQAALFDAAERPSMGGGS